VHSGHETWTHYFSCSGGTGTDKTKKRAGIHKFVFSDGFVFRANKLCIPASSIRLLLLQEAHGGGLMGHFDVKKTEDILAAHFFWPKMRRDVV
jgi:hypothetical protein